MINRTVIEGVIHDEPHLRLKDGQELNILCFEIAWENDILDEKGNPATELYYYDVEVLGHDKNELKGKFKKNDKVVVAGALLLSNRFRPVLLANSIFHRNSNTFTSLK